MRNDVFLNLFSFYFGERKGTSPRSTGWRSLLSGNDGLWRRLSRCLRGCVQVSQFFEDHWGRLTQHCRLSGVCIAFALAWFYRRISLPPAAESESEHSSGSFRLSALVRWLLDARSPCSAVRSETTPNAVSPRESWPYRSSVTWPSSILLKKLWVRHWMSSGSGKDPDLWPLISGEMGKRGECERQFHSLLFKSDYF